MSIRRVARPVRHTFILCLIGLLVYLFSLLGIVVDIDWSFPWSTCGPWLHDRATFQSELQNARVC